ncbi:MAG TPA: hypothetical protein VLH39_03800, partial [Magnetospirillaceae bacterium]|nr:hypothetical protein [Magnetospirillaceae bacterium]
MKDTRTEREARERMKPGVITARGFLGKDERSLADIIQADEETFRRLDLGFDAAAERLEAWRDAGSRGLGEPLTVEGRYLVRTGDARGVLPCPWADGSFHKNSIDVTDVRTGNLIVYSDLSIHLLRAHHFCQGAGNPFRLDPGALA